MKHITIKDIARHLSLSVSTVSRALMNDKNIRKETKVIQAGKNFDMIVLPGSTHGFFGENGDFFERKMWFHFAKYLLGDDSANYQGDIDYFMKKH